MRLQMSINNHSYFLIFLVFLIVSCNSDDFNKTQSGLKYNIVKEGDGPEFKDEDYILLAMDYYDEKDSLLFSYTEKGIPVTIRYNDTLWDQRGQVYEGFKMLKVGDSAIFKVNCDNLYSLSFRGEIPYGLNPNSDITFYVGVVATMNSDEFRLWQADQFQKRKELQIKQSEDQLYEDLSIIDMYLDEKGLIAMELESGLRYVVDREGTGPKPEMGDSVIVKYTGYLLDGTQFDSSDRFDKPYIFEIGSGKVINAWDEGITLMSKGAKFTFYVPSPLGYGTRGIGKLIEPNAILMFDVELMEIVKKNK